MRKTFLEIGKIVAVQGLKGEVRVEPWCDTVKFLCGFKELYLEKGEKKLIIEKSRPHKEIALLKINGVETVEEAAKYRGKILYMNREDVMLEDGCYFVQDLIGLRVVDVDTGEEYGELSDVSETGANDVYYIKRDNVTYLIPAIPDVIMKTDLDEGKMFIKPMKGLFDDAD
ncbi:MAG: ribosome maturation factor RimM [Oscillospiraceae bacterium]